LSDGGLIQALAESSFHQGIGVVVELDDPFIDLFSESSARAMVAVRPENHEAFVELADSFDVSLATIGLTGGTSLTVDGQFDIDVAELRADWKATLPAILGTII
ncbi:MAG: phosphoribosylformylglycinamidine synthase II, partial [Aeromicrobium sp.]